MNDNTKLIKSARIWHRNVASILFVFFFIISITGILLGWKNIFADKIYATDSKQKSAKSMNEWLPLDSLKIIAIAVFHAKVSTEINAKPESINARFDKGFIRFSFSNNYNIQLNAKTGELQSIDKKAPEWFVKFHDGEIIDDVFKIKNGISKKIYTSIIGLSLFFLTLSGFWMWIKPKQIKNVKRRKENQS